MDSQHGIYSISTSRASTSKPQTSGCFLIEGEAEGDIVVSNVPISFMMGVNAQTGVVQDRHHPLLGASIKDKILVIPRGRGSCSGSGVIAEMLLVGSAPAALIFRAREDILTLGVLLAKTMFSKSIPVVLVGDNHVWAVLSRGGRAQITDGQLLVQDMRVNLAAPNADEVALTPDDERMLRGEGCSAAAQLAMGIIVTFAAIQGARSLISVSQVHVDACCLVGSVSLIIPQRLHALGGKVAVPSTCNSLGVDRRRWREIGADPELSQISHAIGDVYLAMGAQMSFTCAPYLLDSKPGLGEQVGWGESNAVVYANSVLGAHTQKFPDYLEVMVALTGRAPYVGCHLPEGRVPTVRIDVPALDKADDSLFPLLGYHVGEIVGSSIPIIYGLEKSNPRVPDLKAFGAGFATTSSAPMFHMNNVTPEAFRYENIEGLEYNRIHIDDLRRTWKVLNTAADDSVDLISLGNPHFTFEEFTQLATLVEDRKKKSSVTIIITTGRFIYEKALKAGYVDKIERFGASLVTDTCWCMLAEPIIPLEARNIMTNSSKYAHYGPGISQRRFHFGSLGDCVISACSGQRSADSLRPAWLF